MPADALAAWTGVIGAALGALLALVGVGMSEFGHSRRADRAERDAGVARREARRQELWNISLPAGGRVQDLFATVIRLAQRENADEYEPQAPFEEGFPEWWDERRRDLVRDIALIPSSVIRGALTTAHDGIDIGFDLVRLTGYATGYQRAVARMAVIGFDVASAWLRDEPELDADLQRRLDDLASKIYEADQSALS